MTHKYVIIMLIAFMLFGCHSNPTGEGNANTEPRTPVTITHAGHETLTETVELNAVSAFLLKTRVNVNTNGYLNTSTVSLGDYVNKGAELFEIKTKEATVLENTVNNLDPGFHFKGILSIKAPGSGYITSIEHQAGDYVQEGDQVATISDAGSFVFLLDLPYELTPYLPLNKTLTLQLPDGTRLNGRIEKGMPAADMASQTQSYIIKTDVHRMIPESLVAKVSFVKKIKANVISLPKEAVLTNETQSQFWIMMMFNDSLAAKIPVEKGMEAGGRVEIIAPPLNADDKILLTGNYGLPDTVKVEITAGH